MNDQSPAQEGQNVKLVRTANAIIIQRIIFMIDLFKRYMTNIFKFFRRGQLSELRALGDSLERTISFVNQEVQKKIRANTSLIAQAREVGDLIVGIISAIRVMMQLDEDVSTAESNTTIINNEFTELQEILNDRTKLIDYLYQQNKRYTLFPSLEVSSSAALLKPEYEIYIAKYGYPETGVFETQLISDIRSSLLTDTINTSTITEGVDFSDTY
tara:strand:+ start:399 stop:1040 length:642 start_codon:yes stop_codon:yes gene_type:complete